ncbi:MAG: hypothetical protein RMY64_26075 [Nostoc sp. DedQUE08]|nr:hypothetical protein [Nostoc sp. DedQUE08]
MTKQSDSDEKKVKFREFKASINNQLKGLAYTRLQASSNKSKKSLFWKWIDIVNITAVIFLLATGNSPIIVFSISAIFTGIRPFNWFIYKVFFSKEIQANIVDQWYRWARKGHLYACFRMSMYLPQVALASLSIMLEGFKNKRS